VSQLRQSLRVFAVLLVFFAATLCVFGATRYREWRREARAKEADLGLLHSRVQESRAARAQSDRFAEEIEKLNLELQEVREILPVETVAATEIDRIGRLSEEVGFFGGVASALDPEDGDFYRVSRFNFVLAYPSIVDLQQWVAAIESDTPIRRVTGVRAVFEDGELEEVTLTTSTFSFSTDLPRS